jgi:hypothetical protein
VDNVGGGAGGAVALFVVLVAAAGAGFHGWGPTSATASTTTKTTAAKTKGAGTHLSLKVRPRVVHETETSGVTATLSLHDSRTAAGQTVEISSEQLQQVCPGGVTYTWGTVSSPNEIDVVLDKAASATVIVTSTECAPGAFTVLANFLDPPYDTASGTVKVFTVKPPAHMSIAVTPNPAHETSGVPIDEVLNLVTPDALQPVTISSPDLVAGCTSVIFKNADGATSANTITVPVNIDYQATVTFEASNCQASTYQITGDALEVPYPTASTSLQVVAPSS